MNQPIKFKTGLFFSIFCLLILSPSLTTSAAEISDVSKNHPQFHAINNLVENQIFALDSENKFNPEAPINQVSFLKASLNYAGFSPKPSLNFFTGYLDVPEESWFAPYVKRALEIRLINNVPDTNFEPDRKLNRQEALLWNLQLFGIPTPYNEPQREELFLDIRENSHYNYIYKTAKQNNLNFVQDGDNFYPAKTLTKGDAAELLFKAKLAGKNHGFTENTQKNPDLVIPDKLNKNLQFQIFLDAWEKINSEYLYNQDIDQSELMYGAINGMINKLNDPHTIYKKPNQNQEQVIFIPEEYDGIGIVIEKNQQDFVVQAVLTNSPAHRAGLKFGDIIMDINQQSLIGMQLEEVFGLIQNSNSTKINLTIKRADEILTFSINREKINGETVHLFEAAPNINLLRIDTFALNSDQEFSNILNQIKENTEKKLIIDLRNNPGGYLNSTEEILKNFLNSEQVNYYTESSNGAQTPYFSNGNGYFQDWKIAVLINQSSASAAEIFAGALQDYRLAKVFGTTSYGKGSVQEISQYSDQSTFKITVAKWLTPNKTDLSLKGITPDQIITISNQQKAQGEDPQLEAAIKYLQSI